MNRCSVPLAFIAVTHFDVHLIDGHKTFNLENKTRAFIDGNVMDFYNFEQLYDVPHPPNEVWSIVKKLKDLNMTTTEISLFAALAVFLAGEFISCVNFIIPIPIIVLRFHCTHFSISFPSI